DVRRVLPAGHQDGADHRDGGDGVGDGHERGVQQPRHPPDDAHPDEGGEHEDEEQAPEVGIGGGVAGGRRGGGLREEGEQAHAPALASASRVRAWRTSPAWVMTAPCWMSSLKSSTKAFSLVNACTKAVRLREKSRLAWCGMLAGTLSGARIV